MHAGTVAMMDMTGFSRSNMKIFGEMFKKRQQKECQRGTHYCNEIGEESMVSSTETYKPRIPS
jgi:hypothetical protein